MDDAIEDRKNSGSLALKIIVIGGLAFACFYAFMRFWISLHSYG